MEINYENTSAEFNKLCVDLQIRHKVLKILNKQILGIVADTANTPMTYVDEDTSYDNHYFIKSKLISGDKGILGSFYIVFLNHSDGNYHIWVDFYNNKNDTKEAIRISVPKLSLAEKKKFLFIKYAKINTELLTSLINKNKSQLIHFADEICANFK